MDVANPPVFEELIGNGLGVAHCDTMGVLVVSLLADNTLRVFKSPVLEDIGWLPEPSGVRPPVVSSCLARTG